MLRIKLVRSPIGHTARNRATIKALGLRKMHQIVEHDDSASIRGMIHQIQSMVQVEIVEGARQAKAPTKAAAVEPKAPEKKAPAKKAEKSETASAKPAPKPRKKQPAAEAAEVKE